MVKQEKEGVKGLTEEQQGMFDKLTTLQKGMVVHTLKGKKPGEAHKLAGGKGKEEHRAKLGSEILNKPEVAVLLKSVRGDLAVEAKVDALYVLNRHIEIDQMDFIDILNDDLSIKPVTLWPKIWRQFITGFDLAEMFENQGNEKAMVGIMKKIKWPDKIKNLELLGKHVSVGAYRELSKTDVTISHEDWLDNLK